MLEHAPASCLSAEIVSLCHPEEIWLYNAKTDLTGKITSFKICIVADTADKLTLEQQIYLQLDCLIPYDLTIYTPEEWAQARENPFAFARTIVAKGRKLYGKTPQ